MIYSDKQILSRLKTLTGYKGLSELNLVVIRSNGDAPNKYDDKYYFYHNSVFLLVGHCTSNPGSPALLGGWKKYSKDGAAVIDSDKCYYDVYQLGKHKGRMDALVQVKDMDYYRDNNNDHKTDEKGNIFTGNFKTNFHYNSYDILTTIVRMFIGEWSYGCIVANGYPYARLIAWIKNYNKTNKKSTPVTLFLLKQF